MKFIRLEADLTWNMPAEGLSRRRQSRRTQNSKEKREGKREGKESSWSIPFLRVLRGVRRRQKRPPGAETRHPGCEEGRVDDSPFSGPSENPCGGGGRAAQRCFGDR